MDTPAGTNNPLLPLPVISPKEPSNAKSVATMVYIGVAVVILLIIVVSIILLTKKNTREIPTYQITIPSPTVPVVLETQYENPFDQNTDYTNPFSESEQYTNPFETLE